MLCDCAEYLEWYGSRLAERGDFGQAKAVYKMMMMITMMIMIMIIMLMTITMMMMQVMVRATINETRPIDHALVQRLQRYQ